MSENKITQFWTENWPATKFLRLCEEIDEFKKVAKRRKNDTSFQLYISNRIEWREKLAMHTIETFL